MHAANGCCDARDANYTMHNHNHDAFHSRAKGLVREDGGRAKVKGRARLRYSKKH